MVGIPEGEHEFYAIAKDEAGNETISGVVRVLVTSQDGGEGGGDDGDAGGDRDGDGDGDDDGDGDGARPGGSFPPGYGQGEQNEAGCGCASGGSGHSNWWMLTLAPLLFRPRRRGRPNRGSGDAIWPRDLQVSDHHDTRTRRLPGGLAVPPGQSSSSSGR